MPHKLLIGIGLLLLGSALTGLSVAEEIRIQPSEDWEWDVDGIERLLPRWETPEEREAYEGTALPRRRNDPPPLQPIRNVAEFDPMTGVLIRYPLGLPYDLLREMNEDVILSVVVSSSSYNTARNNFQSQGIDPAEVDWIVAANNSIWTRDYGPWFVFDGAGDIAIINHTYNRPWRPDDNDIPLECGAHWGIPVYSHDLWHTGGNYMTDGCGISFSTDLVWDENDHMGEQEIFALMQDYYGLSTYNVVPDISNTGIHHIDTWAKLLDEETVIMKEVSSNHGDYPELEQNATLISSLISSTGRNYEVVRVFCQPIPNGGVASYTNCLILNDKVLVPTFDDADDDEAALQAYRDAMPGYEVLGFSHSGWLTDDALHCRAKGVADREMLYVRHFPIVEWSTYGPIPIRALIDDRSEAGLKTDSLLVHWRAYPDGSPPPSFNATVLAPDEDPDWYVAAIPAQPSGTVVDYYVHAADWSGRREGMPRTEPDAHYSFVVDWPTGVADLPAREGAKLHPARPNPFFPATTFSFELEHADRVLLEVLDLQGRRIRTLVDGTVGAGRHEITWSGRDEAGREVSAGTYFYRLRAAGITYTRKAVLTK
ncbi:MAG: T9SS type A sorting domain-containing protein [Candidatus Eisenbacteria bacterium]|nr:T9SS type A sorting domain-containing protein [Candidatus Latescibacterota bacterium]MBD3301202.1 T9SS type A sorting domain-containing protein [Candidatus Eisenbacteria bacterium]